MRRSRPWSVLAGCAVASATLAGAILGAISGSIGALVPPGIRALICILLGALLLVAVTCSPRRPLQLDRETRQELLERGALRWAIANGALLGVGFASRIGYWVWYLVPIACFSVGSTLWGTAIWGLYSMVRMGVPTALSYRMARRHSDKQMDTSVRLLALKPKAMRIGNLATILLTGVLILAAGL